MTSPLSLTLLCFPPGIRHHPHSPPNSAGKPLWLTEPFRSRPGSVPWDTKLSGQPSCNRSALSPTAMSDGRSERDGGRARTRRRMVDRLDRDGSHSRGRLLRDELERRAGNSPRLERFPLAPGEDRPRGFAATGVRRPGDGDQIAFGFRVPVPGGWRWRAEQLAAAWTTVAAAVHVANLRPQQLEEIGQAEGRWRQQRQQHGHGDQTTTHVVSLHPLRRDATCPKGLELRFR